MRERKRDRSRFPKKAEKMHAVTGVHFSFYSTIL